MKIYTELFQKFLEKKVYMKVLGMKSYCTGTLNKIGDGYLEVKNCSIDNEGPSEFTYVLIDKIISITEDKQPEGQAR